NAYDPNQLITNRLNSLPFPGVDFYALLKAATEVFLMASCGILPTTSALGIPLIPSGPGAPTLPGNPPHPNALDVMGAYDPEGFQRLNQSVSGQQLNQLWNQYVVNFHGNPQGILPYFDVIRQKLGLRVGGPGGGFTPTGTQSGPNDGFPKLGI